MTYSKEIKVLDHGSVRYIAHLGDDLSPLEAARMSTGNPSGIDEAKDDGTRDYLYRHQHATPFEMAELAVEVQLPIFVQNQWVRHRTMSYNSFSGRYAEMPDLFYVPTSERVQAQSETNKQGSGEALGTEKADNLIAQMRFEQYEARGQYQEYLSEGIARELARINLPLSQYTRMRVKANLRNWLNFLRLRLDDHAQLEIRVYAQAVVEIIKELWPKTWEVFEEHTLYAKAFSRTEMEIMRKVFTAYHALQIETNHQWGIYSDELKQDNSEWFERELGKSRAREFLVKLGIEA